MSREKFIIWQYRSKPKALGTIKAIYEETAQTFRNIIQVADILNIDDTTGYELDLVSRPVGVFRVLPIAIAKEYFGWKTILRFHLILFRNSDPIETYYR